MYRLQPNSALPTLLAMMADVVPFAGITIRPLASVFAFLGYLCAAAQTSNSMPKLVERDGRFALMVDGAPFLLLGAQVNNSSASTLRPCAPPRSSSRA